MLLNMIPMELARRVRIESWQDVVRLVVIALLLLGGDTLMKKLFPNMSYSIRRMIVVFGVLAICIAFIFIIHAFS